MNSEETNNLKELGVKSLRNYGFVNVTIDNIMSDEVYRFFFSRFLVTKVSANKKLNSKIESLLEFMVKSS